MFQDIKVIAPTSAPSSDNFNFFKLSRALSIQGQKNEQFLIYVMKREYILIQVKYKQQREITDQGRICIRWKTSKAQ